MYNNKNVYIAGPMRGIYEFNFPAFFEAERVLEIHGYKVFNPARNDMESYGLNTTGMLGDMSEIPDFDLRAAMIWDTQRICESDVIYMLRGWENSTGCRAEHALAVAIGIEIIYQGAM